MFLHTYPRIYIGVLVVVDCGYLLLLTMMMYTHPVSSTSQFIVFLFLLPLSYVGVTRLTAIKGILGGNILSEIHIYLVNIVFINATIIVPNAQNLSCSDHELRSWF